MMFRPSKLSRWVWRALRNLLCCFSLTRNWVYPPTQLAVLFGPKDHDYAWWVFSRHLVRLTGAGFLSGGRVLEVGPGRNLGTGLLWWAFSDATVVLWDVYPNDAIEPETWRKWAAGLLVSQPAGDCSSPDLLHRLHAVLEGAVNPQIEYLVGPLEDLHNRYRTRKFDLIYSQAAMEHVWKISETWRVLANLTGTGGWQSHRIDLADHGRRDTNYLEMLEYPDWAYSSSLCFTPGAINRWRAHEHLTALQALGMDIVSVERSFRPVLPTRRRHLAKRYRHLQDEELRTVGIDFVARRAQFTAVGTEASSTP